MGLEALGIRVDRGGVLTNIVNLDVSPVGWESAALVEKLNQYSIKAKICSQSTMRMVLHNDIQGEDVDFVLGKLEEIVH